MIKFLSYLSTIILTFNSFAIVLGYFGSNWFFDLFSHFQFQYTLIGLIGTIFLTVLKKRIAVLFFLFTLASAGQQSDLYLGASSEAKEKDTFKIVSINLLSSNGDFETVKQLLTEENPDVLVLQEMTDLWSIMLETELARYFRKMVIPRTDNFGIAIYSRIPVESIEQINIGEAGLPSIAANIIFNEQRIHLLATHPLPPVGKEYFEYRNDQLEKTPELTSSIKEPIILVGDLNTSSFSRYFKSLVNKADLKDSRSGFGSLPTWPTWFTLAYTTLDHCLVSKEIKVIDRKVGPHIGSDHLPIIVELGL